MVIIKLKKLGKNSGAGLKGNNIKMKYIKLHLLWIFDVI